MCSVLTHRHTINTHDKLGGHLCPKCHWPLTALNPAYRTTGELRFEVSKKRAHGRDFTVSRPWAESCSQYFNSPCPASTPPCLSGPLCTARFCPKLQSHRGCHFVPVYAVLIPDSFLRDTQNSCSFRVVSFQFRPVFL